VSRRTNKHTLLETPTNITPTELDDRLARGWYRVGRQLLTCQFWTSDGSVQSTIWTRVPLTGGPPLKRSHRKLVRKVQRRFDVRFDANITDPANEALYQRYVTVARGKRSPSLHAFLGGDEGMTLFDTRRMSVWDGDRLIAFSLFDVGDRSTQSLKGAYDPDYSRHSLGFLSMLLEIQWAQEAGLDHFYAGYVIIGSSSMDYKLRPDGVEFLDGNTGKWRPYVEFHEQNGPAEQLYKRLESVRAALHQQGMLAASIVDYPDYSVGAGRPHLKECLSEPLVVDCLGRPNALVTLMVVWRHERQRYEVLHCARAELVYTNPDGTKNEELSARQVWVQAALLAHAASVDEIAAGMAGVLGRFMRASAPRKDA
jgi:leucyl-tRNA---protein transferase